MSERLDLNQLVKRGTVELGPEEHPEERAARLGRDRRRDLREHILFFAVLVGLLATGTAAAWVVLLDRNADPETRKYAQTLLTLLVSGGAGFLFGRALPRDR